MLQLAQRTASKAFEQKPGNITILGVGVFLSLTILGCSTPHRQRQNLQVERPEYEVITVEKQARDALSASATEFQVSGGEDVTYWARVKLFLSNYTEPDALTIESLNPDGVRYSNRRTRVDRFIYEIERYPSKKGYVYLIRCSPRKGEEGREAVAAGVQNAQNLARFIREGQLELSLLHQ